MKKSICLLVIGLHLAGCTTLNAVPYSNSVFEGEAVRKGDQVVLATTGGERRFEVTSVTPEQICGKDECVRTEAIESVKREEFSASKTAAAVGGIALAVLAVGALSMAFHPMHFAPAGGCFLCKR
jgi:hypothetical protein